MTTALDRALDFAGARAALAPYLRRTPLLRLEVLTPQGPLEAALKLELLQVTGSFKVRGALRAVAASGAPEVVACSGGNHGLGVAHAARVLGRHATIFLPADAPAAKVEGLRRLGAHLRIHGTMAEAFTAAAAFAADRGLPLVHPYDQAEVIEGQGTLGLELREEAPEVREWAIAVGGGGLAAGLVLALEGAARVVAVEPETCAGYAAALRAGRPVEITPSGPARSSLGAPRVGDLPFEVLRRRSGPPFLVTDAALMEAQAWLWREVRLLAEPGACAGLAALLAGRWKPEGAAGLVICGGNADAMPTS